MQTNEETSERDYAGVIATHLQKATLAEMPSTAIARAKERVLDSIGNLLAGVDATGNAAARSVFHGYGGTPDATVVGTGSSLPAPHAAFLNAMSMRSYDYEAVGAESSDASMVAAHISGTTVPVALAAGERAGASGAQFLEALILGDDLASRLAVSSGFHTASGGDNTGTVNVMGGAAIVGKIEGFNETQYRHALGHALNQMSGTVQNLFDKASSFKLPQAMAARNAIVSADLAKAGFSGLHDALTSPFGFFKLFSPKPNPEALLCSLGESYFGDMIIKPWASCRAAHPALDAVVRLRKQHALDPGDVEAVEIHVTPTTKNGFTGQDFSGAPASEVDGIFSIPYNVAVGLIEGTVRPEHLSADYMTRTDVLDLLGRVTLVGSLPPHEYQTAEAIVTTRSGQTYRQRVDGVLGDIYRNPLSREAVLEKFYLNVEFGNRTTKAVSEQIQESVDHLDELDDLSTLLRMIS